MSHGESNNLWLFLEVLAKRKGFIFLFAVVITLISLIISLSLPKWYKAEALLLPPKNMSIPMADLEILSEAVSVTSGLNLPVLATPSDVYVRIMKSRSICSEIVEQFALKQRYEKTTFEETYNILLSLTDFSVTDEGLLSVAVEDKDPAVAAEIANAFVEKLDILNQRIVADRIQHTSSFVSSRVEEIRRELDTARSELENFQMKYKAVDFDEQTRLAIEQAAQLKIKLSELDFEVQLSKITLGQNNAKLVELQKKKEIIELQLSNLENINHDSSFFSLPVSSIPAIKGQYELLYSRVKVAEGLYQVLLNQQEQIKMKELEKMPTITILDRAVPPELKSRPKRSYIVTATFILSLIFGIFFAVIMEYLTKLEKNNPDDYQRARFFINSFFGWLPGVKKIK